MAKCIIKILALGFSNNSLTGAPAFVAFAAGGGILWLPYELAVDFGHHGLGDGKTFAFWPSGPCWWADGSFIFLTTAVIGFFVAYAAGYMMSLIFPAPLGAKLFGTLVRWDGPQKRVPRRSWRPYIMILALYGTGIFALLLIVTLVF